MKGLIGLFLAMAFVRLLLPPAGPAEADPSPLRGPSARHARILAPVIEIPLAGEAARRSAELSGMAWNGEHLILLPQYPGRFKTNGRPALFHLAKKQILDFLSGRTQAPLTPGRTVLDLAGLDADGGPLSREMGFQGFEAICFDGDRAFLTVECEQGGLMSAWLMAGAMAPDSSRLVLDPASAAPVPMEIQVFNRAYEALVVDGGEAVLLHESPGAPGPSLCRAFVFGVSGARPEPAGFLPFPFLDHRLTDASALDSEKRFWAFNYHYPREEDGPAPGGNPLEPVERLVEFQKTPAGIVRTKRPMIVLQDASVRAPRNWEALARLDGEGFLAAADMRPRTILAFIPCRMDPP